MIDLASLIATPTDTAIVAGIVYGSAMLRTITKELGRITTRLDTVANVINDHSNRLTILEVKKEQIDV
ncbi:MAG TPA: hypothetical protein DFI00_08240 [Rhodospirillaceae bacterium]|nr:hypothetical protein [Alphaproteobacteria bacterium]OUT42369.1 MAG: hypothetical protein CBB62_08825 [Micavibrio sp. TMED2]HCI47269.1 hypothetical protein [Rhodospirillaceae bacterium]MAS45996.1 hypothetical protein [Alphaproteobacteria bacterium]MAX95822.1 hypothetical protein [Alphaproteobacteria bacterium]|tara:strand:- start:3722 stop:3925 length:204 start_codon:yes stop_codon:yes gene_type:complete